MKAVGVRPTRGDFGLPDARIIKPGDPCASTLYFRMAKFGRDRMPHIGSERPDEAGLKLIEQWIAGMDGGAEAPSRSPDSGPPDQLLASPRSALLLARKLGRGELKPAERDALLAAAAKLPPGPIRDLFEGYLPVGREGRAQARLEPPAPSRSWPSRATPAGARSCSGRRRSTAAAATRSATGARRSGRTCRPSASFVRARTCWRASWSRRAGSSRSTPPISPQTTDGRSLTGLLVKRDEKEVVLRDGQNKEIVLAAEDVEELRPSRVSLMPDGQMAGLTAQEAADLLEYLATRK